MLVLVSCLLSGWWDVDLVHCTTQRNYVRVAAATGDLLHAVPSTLLSTVCCSCVLLLRRTWLQRVVTCQMLWWSACGTLSRHLIQPQARQQAAVMTSSLTQSHDQVQPCLA
jgi:hypothetical protein